MNKIQFLEELGQKLSEELPRAKVISNLQYYERYIDGAIRAGKSEKEVLDELGDPNLIARTIMDTETGEAFYEEQFAEDADYVQTETTYEEKDGKYTAETEESTGWNSYQTVSGHGCLIMALILILLVTVVAIVLGKVISFLWPVLVPVLLILLVISVFSDKRR